jgi:hypothetical protein
MSFVLLSFSVATLLVMSFWVLMIAAPRVLALVGIGHRPLGLVTLGSLALLVTSLALQQVDPRLVSGVSAWLKPAKFAASIALTAPMLAWILGQMTGARARRLHVAGTVIGVVAALELVIITVQAARGVPSHFNGATLVDGLLFSIMGAAISVLWLAELYLTVRAFRHTFATGVRTWGIRLGLVGTLAGGAVGYLMPVPTPAQRAALAAGQRPTMLGAHSVGVPDGGPGLPVTRWSTEGGDLRVPHFIGLHALQVLPFAALVLERRRRRASARPIVALGVGWIGLTLVALAQALRAQPVLAPDALTIAAALAIVLAAAAIAIGVPGRGRASSERRAVSRLDRVELQPRS